VKTYEQVLHAASVLASERDKLETRLHGSFSGQGSRPAENRQEAAEIIAGLRLLAEQGRLWQDLADEWEGRALDVWQNIDQQNELRKKLREEHKAGKHEDTRPPFACPDCEPTSLEDMIELDSILKDEAA
jgi:hypothetical protein